MRKTLAIIAAKIMIFIGKLFNRGSVIGGHIALKIYPNIMESIKIPKTVVAVTGSSGKGSTTKMIADTLRNLGYSVLHNSSGANLKDGILSAMLETCSLSGINKEDVFVIEMDERYAKYVFPIVKPNYVIITNITRDQPPRQGNFDLVYKEILKSLTNNMHLILNADDPYMQKFAIDTKCDITYFGIDNNEYSYKANSFENLNLSYCPLCNNKLDYSKYHFENIGHYKCTKCDLVRPKPKYVVTKIDYLNNEVQINNNNYIRIPFNMLFTIYNTLASYTLLELITNKTELISKYLNSNINSKKLFGYYKLFERKIYTLNNKNENSTTFNQSIIFIDRQTGKKTIIIGWKEISRRYEYNDISWLYDINFEILNKHDIDKIVCVGVQEFDIAQRIKIAGFNKDNIICFDSLKKATDYIKEKTKGDIYAILNFDYVKPFNDLMKEDNI